MGDTARGERELARPAGDELLAELKGELAFEDVEGLVEVVAVQSAAVLVP